MISTNQFKNGMTIEINGEVYFIVNFQHVKPGKGAAFVRTKLKTLKSKKIVEKTFRAGEKVEQAFLEEKKIQFLYKQNNIYHFMDQRTFEEIELPMSQIKDKVGFIKDNLVLTATTYDGTIVNINLPNFVNLKVTHTEPGVRADTVKAAMKSATLETDAQIEVPLFINKGNTIKIDTRSGKYIGRI